MDTTHAFCNIVQSFAKDTFSGKMKYAGTASLMYKNPVIPCALF